MLRIHRISTGRLTRPGGILPQAPSRRLRTLIAADFLPRTVVLCIHCRNNPAGFWVSRKNGQVVRRPWCLSCCHRLDRDQCDITQFAG